MLPGILYIKPPFRDQLKGIQSVGKITTLIRSIDVLCMTYVTFLLKYKQTSKIFAWPILYEILSMIA